MSNIRIILFTLSFTFVYCEILNVFLEYFASFFKMNHAAFVIHKLVYKRCAIFHLDANALSFVCRTVCGHY
jgi:hypothetical protein